MCHTEADTEPMTCEDVPDRRWRTMIVGIGQWPPTDQEGMTRMQGNVVVVTVNESENVRAR
jgi:hypothetical protein